MLKENWRVVSGLSRSSDNVVIICSFFLSYWLRGQVSSDSSPFIHRWIESFEIGELGSLDRYFLVLLIAIPLYNILLGSLGSYRSMRMSSGKGLLRQSFISSVLVFFSVSALLFMLKMDLSRSFIGLFCLMTTGGLFIVRLSVLALLRFFRKRGKNYRNLLIVGSEQGIDDVRGKIEAMPELGINIVGQIALSERGSSFTETSGSYSKPRFENQGLSASEFESSLKFYAVDEVLFTDTLQYFERIRSLAPIAQEEGIAVTLTAGVFGSELFKSDISYFGDLPLIHYQSTPTDTWALVLKRLLDIGFSCLGILILWPLMMLIAIAVKLDSKGPVFFVQERIGLNGRKFKMLKFRSMTNDAEQLVDQLKDKNEMTGPVFKIESDPRITKVGRLIRRYSIDELPQLFNVLTGDMSLVGPRPPLPSEVSEYKRSQRRRLSMRPGLTCIWQVSGRNKIPDFKKWAELDLQYIDNWSLWGDFKLLARTIPSILKGEGS